MNELTVNGIIINSIKLGLKNAPSIIGAIVLWLLTIWIPYINIGTTIAIFGGLIVELSKGNIISPIEIFDAKYRKNMGEIFLLWGLMVAGIVCGFMFFIIPGYVIAIAWLLSLPLLVDRNINPIEAMTLSNKLTYGKKWTIFLSLLLVSLVGIIVIGILAGVFSLLSITLAGLIGFIGYLGLFSINIAVMSYIYGELTKKEESS